MQIIKCPKCHNVLTDGNSCINCKNKEEMEKLNIFNKSLIKEFG